MEYSDLLQAGSPLLMCGSDNVFDVPPLHRSQHALHTPQPDPTSDVRNTAAEYLRPSLETSAEQERCLFEPTERDWERFKPQITDLYSQTKLDDLVKTMKRDHGFKASAKMYRSRINKWKIDKNIKSAEKEAIIRKEAQRTRAGKKSAFRLRGTDVPRAKIVRFRRAEGISSVEQALQLRASTPPELDCYTPMASPLSTPREIGLPERIIKLTQEWIYGSVDSGKWQLRDNFLENWETSGTPITTFMLQCNHIDTLLCAGNFMGVGQALDLTMAAIEPMLRNERSNTLGDTVRAFNQLASPGALDIVHKVLQQCAAMSAVVTGVGHPFQRIFAFLTEVDFSCLEHVLTLMLRMHVDSFARQSGRFSWNTILIQWSLRWLMPAEQAMESCLALHQEVERSLGISSPQYRYTLLELGFCYCRMRDCDKAIEIARKFFTLPRNLDSWFKEEGFRLLAYAYEILSQRGLAIQNIRRAIAFSIDAYGWQDEMVLVDLQYLESLLKDSDRRIEAAEVRKQWTDILNAKHATLKQAEEERYRRCMAQMANPL